MLIKDETERARERARAPKLQLLKVPALARLPDSRHVGVRLLKTNGATLEFADFLLKEMY